MKKKFKYSNEYSIGMYLSTYHILQQIDLDEFAKTQHVFTSKKPCNIYFVLKRPRISLDPSYLKETDNCIELKYYIHRQTKKLDRFIEIPKTKQNNYYRLSTQYPYNFLRLTNAQGGGITSKLAVLVDELHKKKGNDDPELDFEVLYIGQAFGKNGRRTALDRLSSHSTLQKIYAEAINNNPDSEIWLMLAHFSEQNIGTMSGLIEVPKKNEKEDLNRFKNFMSSQNSNFSENQKINFTEAALIQMFLPLYNKTYKGTFPSQEHNSYKECYDLGVNGIVVETDTSEVRRRLYSSHLPRESSVPTVPMYYQFGEFHFVSDKDRYKMFNNEYLGLTNEPN